MTLLITACSKEKSATRSVSAANLLHAAAAELAAKWISMLDATDLVPARNRYSGRGHRHAVAAADRHQASHLIMSAGLGLVRSSDRIPAYELTFKRSEEDSICPHLIEPEGLFDWWNALERVSPWSRKLGDECDGEDLIVVALPVDYLQILGPALDQLAPSTKARLRVINAAPSSALPERLRPYHLSYDGRLDGPDSASAGTGSDFLGRAAGHFLGLVEGQTGGSLDHHRALVHDVLAPMRPAERRQGRSFSDEAIAAVIRSELERSGPGSAKILRRFRDQLGIACEQKRFQRLYAGVMAEGALA